MSVDEELRVDKNIHEILSVLSEGNLKLDEDTIKEIKIRLKHLFEMIELNVGKEANIDPEQAHGLINENFLQHKTDISSYSTIQLNNFSISLPLKIHVIHNV